MRLVMSRARCSMARFKAVKVRRVALLKKVPVVVPGNRCLRMMLRAAALKADRSLVGLVVVLGNRCLRMKRRAAI